MTKITKNTLTMKVQNCNQNRIISQIILILIFLALIRFKGKAVKKRKIFNLILNS